jgi:uncharacterized protein (UPF0335 family)
MPDGRRRLTPPQKKRKRDVEAPAARATTAPRPARKPRSISTAMVPVQTSVERHRTAAERQLEETIARLSRLDGEHEALSQALSDFSERYDEQLGATLDALFRAERVQRRLEQLEAALLAAFAPVDDENGDGRRSARSNKRKSAAATENAPSVFEPPRPSQPPPVVTAAADLEWDLKALYRRLARRLHPDRASDDDDRVRRGELMTRLNAAYSSDDRVRLELLGLEIDGGDEAPHVAEAPEAYAERRLVALTPMLERLEVDLRRLRNTAIHRRYAEAERFDGRGEDYFANELERTEIATRRVESTTLDALLRVEAAIRAANARFTQHGPAAFAAVRPASAPGSPTAAGDRFAAELGVLARECRWKAAYVFAAFFAEVAERGLSSATGIDGWVRWHAALALRHRGTPPLEKALAELPAAIELGLRLHPHGLRLGVYLREPALLAGVVAALEKNASASVAADVLLSLSDVMACPECQRNVTVLHVHRLRDVDPLHGFACARCGAVLESYRAIGRPGGAEALSPYARRLGLTGDITVEFGGTLLAFEMSKGERARLTAGRLGRLFAELVLQGLGPDVERRRLRFKKGRSTLAGSARIPEGETVAVSLVGPGGPTERRLVALLRARQRRRFQAPAKR